MGGDHCDSLHDYAWGVPPHHQTFVKANLTGSVALS
jgi:hypothetical protein